MGMNLLNLGILASISEEVIEGTFKFQVTPSEQSGIIDAMSLTNPGTNYLAGEMALIYVIDPENYSATIIIDTVGESGEILTYHLIDGGINHQIETFAIIYGYMSSSFDAEATIDSIKGGYVFILPIVDGGEGYTHNFIANWGDTTSNSITSFSDINRIHIYESSGTYDIELNGTCEYFAFNNLGTKDSLKKLLEFTGNIGFKVLNFYGCTNLDTIISLETLISLIDVSSLFRSCTLITSIPSGIFDNNIKIINFSYAFNGCLGITSIPPGLFDNNVKVESFRSCFYTCNNLTGAIPTDLFKYNALVTDFGNCFSNCGNLTGAIPTGLFDNNPLVTDFGGTFAACRKLTSIPTCLFDNNSLVTYFNDTFYFCDLLTSIPTGLFDNCTVVTDFTGIFSQCYGLTGAIPTGLFDNNPLVENLSFAFLTCYGITSIPDGLFDTCTLVTNFQSTFQQTAITSIPEGLFDNCTVVTMFYRTFDGCSSLDGDAPELWLRDPEPNGFQCFGNCTGLDNYSGIPAGWK
jgi:hypothetical protein